MKILDVPQGSEAWHRARLGIPTASRFEEIITPAKGDKSKGRTGYLHRLLAERLTGEPSDDYTSEWMNRGNELEAAARSAYEFLQDTAVTQVGLMLNDAGTIGASPDGLIGQEGGLEIKCPKPATMVGYMIEGKLPTKYRPQVQGNLWISGRDWWDFVAYHPGMDLFVTRVYRDEEYIARMERYLLEFVEEMETHYQRIKP